MSSRLTRFMTLVLVFALVSPAAFAEDVRFLPELMDFQDAEEGADTDESAPAGDESGGGGEGEASNDPSL